MQVSISVWAEGRGEDIFVLIHRHITTFSISNLMIRTLNISYQAVHSTVEPRYFELAVETKNCSKKTKVNDLRENPREMVLSSK